MNTFKFKLSSLALALLMMSTYTVLAQENYIPSKYSSEQSNQGVSVSGHFSPTLDLQEKPSPARKASGTVGDANITINYSSPAVKNRTVWGDLVPYNKVWRAGANEATIFETDKDIKVEGKELKAGKYSLFAIPTQGEWTIIFNEETGQWGTQHDESKDVLRVNVTPRKSDQMNDRLTYEVEGDKLILKWEQMEVPVSISK